MGNLDSLAKLEINHPTIYTLLECTLAPATLLGIVITGFF